MSQSTQSLGCIAETLRINKRVAQKKCFECLNVLSNSMLPHYENQFKSPVVDVLLLGSYIE
jgi:hypothetical protein